MHSFKLGLHVLLRLLKLSSLQGLWSDSEKQRGQAWPTENEKWLDITSMRDTARVYWSDGISCASTEVR